MAGASTRIRPAEDAASALEEARREAARASERLLRAREEADRASARVRALSRAGEAPRPESLRVSRVAVVTQMAMEGATREQACARLTSVMDDMDAMERETLLDEVFGPERLAVEAGRPRRWMRPGRAR